MATSLYALQDTGGVVLKNDIIVGAYSQLRISGITRSPTPEDLELALDRLEDMAAEFNETMPVGYNFEDTPDPNSAAGIKRALSQAFKTNLAVRLIPDFNKDVSPVLLAQASQSLSFMASQSAMQRIQRVQYPERQPLGSGNTRWTRWANFYRVNGEIPSNSANSSMFMGDIQDFVEHYDAYLGDTETISSFSLVVDTGLTVISSSNATPDIHYRLQADSTNNASDVLQVTLIVTTDTGRIETRRRFIQVVPVN